MLAHVLTTQTGDAGAEMSSQKQSFAVANCPLAALAMVFSHEYFSRRLEQAATLHTSLSQTQP
jgi:hypothetical protein